MDLLWIYFNPHRVKENTSLNFPQQVAHQRDTSGSHQQDSDIKFIIPADYFTTLPIRIARVHLNWLGS